LANRFPIINTNKIKGFSQETGLKAFIHNYNKFFIGTSDNGIYVLDTTRNKLLRTINFAAISNYAESNFINNIYDEGNGNLIAASYKGAFRSVPGNSSKEKKLMNIFGFEQKSFL
jgi:hypothetical protein